MFIDLKEKKNSHITVIAMISSLIGADSCVKKAAGTLLFVLVHPDYASKALSLRK